MKRFSLIAISIVIAITIAAASTAYFFQGQ